MVGPRVRSMLLTTALILAAWGAAYAWQQYPIGRPTADNVAPMGAGHGPDDEPFSHREIEMHQLKMLHEMHQKQVIADTDRLLKLATQLKQQTDQGVTASPSELKDVDEIGKLAKKLSERIKSE